MTEAGPGAKRVSFVTLGCKVNQYETQAFREALGGEGFVEAGEGETADVVVVNACVVTGTAERESRSAVRRALRRNPGARVVATGCLTAKSKAILSELADVEIVAAEEKNQVAAVAAERAPDLVPSSVSGLSIRGMAGRARAFVKVQDGCGLNCSFCIIPTVRGSLRSRAAADIVAEVRELARTGYREIVLTGVHLGHYGRGKGERDRLHRLLAELAGVEGIARIRLSSIESVELRPELLDVLASSEVFCPHFHLPLQSGNDRVLAAMRRRYTVAEFMAGVEDLWRRFERPSLSTDVIIGFPTETEAEFEDTLRIMRECGFGRTHVFRYSDREGTDAAAMTPKVPPAEKQERTARAIALGDRLARRYSRLFLGEAVEFLAESRSAGPGGELWSGYSERYLKLEVADPEGRLASGGIAPVRIDSVAADGVCRGTVVAPGVAATVNEAEARRRLLPVIG